MYNNWASGPSMRYWVSVFFFTNQPYLLRRLVWSGKLIFLFNLWLICAILYRKYTSRERSNTGFKFGRTFGWLAKDANKFFSVLAEIANNLYKCTYIHGFFISLPCLPSLVIISCPLAYVPHILSLDSLASLPFPCLYSLVSCLLSIFESHILSLVVGLSPLALSRTSPYDCKQK